MQTQCQIPNCNNQVLISAGGRGRPKKYCPDCAEAKLKEHKAKYKQKLKERYILLGKPLPQSRLRMFDERNGRLAEVCCNWEAQTKLHKQFLFSKA